MVIFQYNLYIFVIHYWTMLYPKPCYNKPYYKEVEVYLMSLGSPTDIGLQLGKACYPCSRRECFYFFCFFSFIPVPLSSQSRSFISSTMSSISFLPFSGRRHKMTHKGWHVVKPQNNQSIKLMGKFSKWQTDALVAHLSSLSGWIIVTTLCLSSIVHCQQFVC